MSFLRQGLRFVLCLIAIPFFIAVPGVASSSVTHVDLDQTRNSPSNKFHQMTYAVRRGVGLSVPLEWKPYLFWHESMPLALLEYESENRTISLSSAGESDLEPILKYIHLFDGVPAENIPAIQDFLYKRFQNKIQNKTLDKKAISVADNLRLCFEYLLQVDHQINTNFFIHEVLKDLPRNLKFLSGAGSSKDFSYWGPRIWNQVSVSDAETISQFFKVASGLKDSARDLLLRRSTKLEDPLMGEVSFPFESIYRTLSEAILQEQDLVRKADFIRFGSHTFPFLKSSVQYYQNQIHHLDTSSEDIPRSFLQSEIQAYKNLIQSSLQAGLGFIHQIKAARLRTGLYVFYEDQFQQLLQKQGSSLVKGSAPSSDTNPWPFSPSNQSLLAKGSQGSCEGVFFKADK